MTRWGTGVLDRLPLEGHERVLDAGCGSGRVTEQLLDRLRRTDAWSPSTARRRWSTPRGSASPGSATGSSTSSPTSAPRSRSTATVDAVLSTATFHWVPDHDALFRNLAAVTRPGGRLVAQCGGVGNIASVKRALADDRRWLARHGALRDAAGDHASPRCGRLRRHRMLADRRTDPARGGRAAPDVPAHRGPRRPPRPPAGRRARRVRRRRGRPTRRTGPRLRAPEHHRPPARLTTGIVVSRRERRRSSRWSASGHRRRRRRTCR